MDRNRRTTNAGANISLYTAAMSPFGGDIFRGSFAMVGYIIHKVKMIPVQLY